MRGLAGAFGLLMFAAVLGCGGDGSGPKRFRVSGNVTHDGKPIAFGDVVITPDAAKKNSGPQGFANIRGGKFDTAAPGGKGYGGGPAIVRVTGFEKEGGKRVCEQEFPVELPAGDATKDLDVPKGKGKAAGEDI
ncbi:MAG TPA: hypothetical protein VGE74_19590 [Gemmata sp.]